MLRLYQKSFQWTQNVPGDTLLKFITSHKSAVLFHDAIVKVWSHKRTVSHCKSIERFHLTSYVLHNFLIQLWCHNIWFNCWPWSEFLLAGNFPVWWHILLFCFGGFNCVPLGPPLAVIVKNELVSVWCHFAQTAPRIGISILVFNLDVNLRARPLNWYVASAEPATHLPTPWSITRGELKGWRNSGSFILHK